LEVIMAFPWIAAAILAGSAYQAYQGRRAAGQAREQQTTALAQQAADQAAMRAQMAEQTRIFSQQASSLEAQARTAREQFDTAQLQYAENKSEMDRRAREIQATAEEERRKAAASESSALRARTRGGRRSLLSSVRPDAELGIESPMIGVGTRMQ
jgi:hypothetical protein